MSELVERIGYPRLVQLIMECWNEIFLLMLIIVMQIGRHRDKSDELVSKVEIPLTAELIIFYFAVFAYNLANIFTLIYGGHNSSSAYYVMRIGIFCYYLVGAFQTVFFLDVIKKHIARRNNDKGLERVIIGFQLIEVPNVLLLLATPFTGALYYINANNEYNRVWGYYVWQGITIITFLFIGAVALIYRKRTDRFIKQIIAVAFIFPVIGLLLSVVSSAFNFNNIMVFVSELLMFMLYEKNKTEVTLKYGYELEKAKTELAEARLSLMQAQIKPHFINNALIAVQEVCYTDPKRAAELIEHFARYLRNNINATSSSLPIEFKDEVQAVKEYLAIEHADTGKKFQFEFDIKCESFRVPALSIEPLVENAVKHGIDRYSEESRVVLSSYETQEAFHVTIRDNGGGFDMNAETLGKGGIGLKNTEERLRKMCGGSLEIKRDNGWTEAEIIIPRAQEVRYDNSNT
ncbi:MAG: histidine kinase [Ruminococcus sp.]|nr:histidine kinase [Ruminococcus sp.]